MPESAAEPIFIVGSIGSGTSIVFEALRKGAGIPGCRESNVEPLMQRLQDEVADFIGNFSPEYLAAKDDHLVGSLEPKHVETWIENYFAALYAARMGGGRWLARSPDSDLRAPAIRACRRLARMFPKARFIFCARRGIETVMDRISARPDMLFGHHCEAWGQTFAEWLGLLPALAGRTLDVWHREITTRPLTVAEDLRRFLGLGASERDGILRELGAGPGGAGREYRDLGLDETPWTGDHRAEFYDWCRATMETAGFGLARRVHPARERVRLPSPAGPGAEPPRADSGSGPDVFELRPVGRGGASAELRWPAVPLDGESRFSVDTRVEGFEEGIALGLRIERTSDLHVVAVGKVDLRPTADWVRRDVAFPAIDGPHDVVLAARMPEGAIASTGARLLLRDVHLR